jgi:hypothetical protein
VRTVASIICLNFQFRDQIAAIHVEINGAFVAEYILVNFLAALQIHGLGGIAERICKRITRLTAPGLQILFRISAAQTRARSQSEYAGQNQHLRSDTSGVRKGFSVFASWHTSS